MKFAALTLALGLASTSAFATDGTINFYGQIRGGTCPIEIIDPITGTIGSLIQLGDVAASQFTNVGNESRSRAFGMRVTPGTNCAIGAGAKANVTFSALYGAPGAALYGLKPGGADGVAVIIRDGTGKPIDNGVPSDEYLLSETAPTTMYFTAAYKSTLANVQPGAAEADIAFTVAIN